MVTPRLLRNISVGQQAARQSASIVDRGTVLRVRGGANGLFLADVQVTTRVGRQSPSGAPVILPNCQSAIPLQEGQEVEIELPYGDWRRGATVRGVVSPPQAQNLTARNAPGYQEEFFGGDNPWNVGGVSIREQDVTHSNEHFLEAVGFQYRASVGMNEPIYYSPGFNPSTLEYVIQIPDVVTEIVLIQADVNTQPQNLQIFIEVGGRREEYTGFPVTLPLGSANEPILIHTSGSANPSDTPITYTFRPSIVPTSTADTSTYLEARVLAFLEPFVTSPVTELNELQESGQAP